MAKPITVIIIIISLIGSFMLFIICLSDKYILNDYIPIK